MRRRIIRLALLFSRAIIIPLRISRRLLVFLIERSPSQARVACRTIIPSKRETIPLRSLKQKTSCSRAQEPRIIIASYSRSERKRLIVYSRKQEARMALKVLRNSAPVSSRLRIPTTHSTRITTQLARAYSSQKRKVHSLQVRQPGASHQLLLLVYSRARREAWTRLVSQPGHLLYSSPRLRSDIWMQCRRKKKAGIHFWQPQVLLRIQGRILYNKGLVRGTK